MLLLLAATATAGTLAVDMLDIGQGDAILLTTPKGDRILIDAGLKKSETWRTLQNLGVTDLELVIVSHPHADHMGGMADVVARFPIGLYLDNGMDHTTMAYADLEGALKKHAVPSRKARHGEGFAFDDGIVVTVLWPGTSYLTGTRSDLNSNSVVVRVDHGEDCMLFTGDAEFPTEVALTRGGVGRCEVLKVAHHGSEHSSSDMFLRKVQPEIALISVGEDNRYGHPDQETLDRLQRTGSAIYRTDLSGHVSLESSGAGVIVTDGLPWWEPDGPSTVGQNDTPIAAIQAPRVERAVASEPQLEAPQPDTGPDSGTPNLSGLRPTEHPLDEAGSESPKSRCRLKQRRAAQSADSASQE